MSTNVTEFIQDLDVGNFKEKFGAVLSEVAIGVMRSETGAAKGKVTAEFEITMLSSEKVNVKSKLKFVKPTSRGILSEIGDFETRQSIMESAEAKSSGSGDKLPSRIVFKCKPYDVLQERTFIIRISMLTGDKSPRFSFRIINLGMHEKEMAEEFKNVLTNKLGDNIKTYIGNFCS